MLVLAKCFLAKYKCLVGKMGDDLDGNASAMKNYELCDCDIVLGSTCVAHVGSKAKLVQVGLEIPLHVIL